MVLTSGLVFALVLVKKSTIGFTKVDLATISVYVVATISVYVVAKQ